MGKGKTRRKGAVPRLDQAEAKKRTNGVPTGSASRTPPVNGALEHATTVLGGALGAGYAGARSVTATLAPDAMSAALLVCMPDEWTADDEAQSLIQRLSNDE